MRLITGIKADDPNPHEPMVKEPLGEPPEWLSVDQRAIWRQKVSDCPAGMLRSLDGDLLASYVVAVDERNKAIQRLKKSSSRTSKTKKGNYIQSLDMGILNRQTEMIIRLASELGFSPTSRARLKVPQGADGANPFKAHAAKKQSA